MLPFCCNVDTVLSIYTDLHFPSCHPVSCPLTSLRKSHLTCLLFFVSFSSFLFYALCFLICAPLDPPRLHILWSARICCNYLKCPSPLPILFLLYFPPSLSSLSTLCWGTDGHGGGGGGAGADASSKSPNLVCDEDAWWGAVAGSLLVGAVGILPLFLVSFGNDVKESGESGGQ